MSLLRAMGWEWRLKALGPALDLHHWELINTSVKLMLGGPHSLKECRGDLWGTN